MYLDETNLKQIIPNLHYYIGSAYMNVYTKNYAAALKDILRYLSIGGNSVTYDVVTQRKELDEFLSILKFFEHDDGAIDGCTTFEIGQQVFIGFIHDLIELETSYRIYGAPSNEPDLPNPGYNSNMLRQYGKLKQQLMELGCI